MANRHYDGWLNKGLLARLLLGLVSVLLLYLTARRSYLLFHTSVEIFRMLVAVLIFLIGTYTYNYHGNGYLMFSGVVYLSVALLDYAHAITYHGMNILPGYTTNTPTQLWIASRLVEAPGLVIALHCVGKRLWEKRLVIGSLLLTAGLVASIMVFRVFPACFVEGSGLTRFKVASEYVICLFFLAALWGLNKRRELVGDVVYRHVSISLVLNILADLSFTLYTDVYGLMNFVGHVFVATSNLVMFRGVIIEALDKPFKVIFAQLRERALSDSLTGLFNRQALDEVVQDELAASGDESDSFAVMLLDLDHFKDINDQHGHLVGDSVLRGFADIIKGAIRKGDLAFRMGGDEFLVLLRGTDSNDIAQVKHRIEQAVSNWASSDPVVAKTGVSVGTSVWDKATGIDQAIRNADKMLYDEKNKKLLAASKQLLRFAGKSETSSDYTIGRAADSSLEPVPRAMILHPLP